MTYLGMQVGVMDFAAVDAQAMLDDDNRVAEAFDARRVVERALGAPPPASS